MKYIQNIDSTNARNIAMEDNYRVYTCVFLEIMSKYTCMLMYVHKYKRCVSHIFWYVDGVYGLGPKRQLIPYR